MENPKIRPICELIGENFFIPRYQRGYRWGKQEITELLDDILQYHILTSDRENKVSKFYCLQPIVVKRKTWLTKSNETKNGWELIDGQQRLTTLYLIITYLEEIRKKIIFKHIENNSTIFLLDFETREKSKDFFIDKKFTTNIDTSNVDFFHISNAYIIIKEWFSKNGYEIEILNTILKTDYNVSIIWYEAQNETNIEDNSIDLFTRLNDGKIPLTDAELIKALLLQGDRYPSVEERYVKQRLFEIASEWDEIESGLQDEKMWLFLNDTTYHPSSKIEFIFKLLAEKWNVELPIEMKIEKTSKHFEYLVFDRFLLMRRDKFKLNTDLDNDILEPINDIWKEIKDTFSMFCEWYDDHILYHYIGYLLAIDEKNKEKTIKELLQNKEKKKDFIVILKKRIANAIKIKKVKKNENPSDLKKLNEISYGDDNWEIIKILVLFNVETLIRNSKENARFPFHLYKKEKITSIEHIHPQNPDNFDTDEERSIIWLKSHKETLLLLNLKEELNEKVKKIVFIVDILLDKFNIDEFKIVYSDILDLYTEISEITDKEVHTLYNLALVDKDTNSALNNSFFDIKREILKQNKLGKYIPICTQRAFSKYHSSSPQEMIFWSNDDRKSYFGAIETIYNSFIKLL